MILRKRTGRIEKEARLARAPIRFELDEEDREKTIADAPQPTPPSIDECGADRVGTRERTARCNPMLRAIFKTVFLEKEQLARALRQVVDAHQAVGRPV